MMSKHITVLLTLYTSYLKVRPCASPSPLIYCGVMYLMKEGGILSSLDPTTGAVLKMGRTPDALEPYYASPVAADGKVVLVSASGKVTVLKAGAQWEIIRYE